MDINEALRVADELVLAKTGKHLDNLQQEILRGSWQGNVAIAMWEMWLQSYGR